MGSLITLLKRKKLYSMEVAEEIEHILYGDEIRSFQDALKGNSANFERKLERVLDRKDEAGGEESWQGIEVTNKIEEAVAGLKEGEAEVEGALKEMERGAEAVSALKSKVKLLAAEGAEAGEVEENLGVGDCHHKVWYN